MFWCSDVCDVCDVRMVSMILFSWTWPRNSWLAPPLPSPSSLQLPYLLLIKGNTDPIVSGLYSTDNNILVSTTCDKRFFVHTVYFLSNFYFRSMILLLILSFLFTCSYSQKILVWFWQNSLREFPENIPNNKINFIFSKWAYSAFYRKLYSPWCFCMIIVNAMLEMYMSNITAFLCAFAFCIRFCWILFSCYTLQGTGRFHLRSQFLAF